MKSDSIDKLLAAFVAAQGEFPAIPKDGFNPHFKSKFSTLKAMRAATVPVLLRHGLAVSQFPAEVDGKPGLTTWLLHSSGQFIAESSTLAMVKSDPQAQGSALTYLRRYAYGAVLGLVTEEEDDGNAATLSEPKVSQSVLDQIKEVAEAAQVALVEVSEMAKKRFGKPVPALSPREGELLLEHLTGLMVKRDLGAVEVAQ